MGNDLTIRNASANAPKEIKSSAHYSYVPVGITLDGSKFTAGELLVEGQCLVKDNASGKYEKYADSAVSGAGPAIILGANAITPAAVADLNAGTKLAVSINDNDFEMSNAALKALPIAAAVAKPAVVVAGGAINNAAAAGANAATVVTITVNGKAYVVANATLAALAVDSTDAVILAALATAKAADDSIVSDVAEFYLVGSTIHIATRDTGASQSIALAGTWGAAEDEALFEGIFGFAFPVAAVTGAASAADQIVAAIAALALANGVKVSDIATVAVVAGKLGIATKDSGTTQSISITGTWGVAGDEATVEGILGVALPASAAGTGAFPAGKSKPVILDESLKFVVKDDGANPDVTVGQAIVHGAVYEGQLVNCTEAFKAAMPQVRFD